MHGPVLLVGVRECTRQKQACCSDISLSDDRLSETLANNCILLSSGIEKVMFAK